jgi:hypothetical protein
MGFEQLPAGAFRDLALGDERANARLQRVGRR